MYNPLSFSNGNKSSNVFITSLLICEPSSKIISNVPYFSVIFWIRSGVVASPISIKILFVISSCFLHSGLISNPKIHVAFLKASRDPFILPPLKTPISKYFMGLFLYFSKLEFFQAPLPVYQPPFSVASRLLSQKLGRSG